MKSYKLAVVGIILAVTGCLGLAYAKKPSYIVDTSSIGQSNNGVISSDQFLELGNPTSNALRMEGERSLKYGSVDKAIMVLQKSVEMSPDDIETRILYAQALEKKFLKEKEKSPKLYNFLIKQWLFVAKKSEFEDQTELGYKHLAHLTGSLPKRSESTAKYLKRVLIPEDGSVKVAVGNDESEE